MTDYFEYLKLTIGHDFYGEVLTPVDVQPRVPAVFARHGLLIKRVGGEVLVLGPQGAHPQTIALALYADDPEVFAITRPFDPARVPMLKVTYERDDWRLTDGPLEHSARTPQQADCLALLNITLHATRSRSVHIQFDTVTAFWTYHIVGQADHVLDIRDARGRVVFDDLGLQTMPNGEKARLFRSQMELALHTTPSKTFSLRQHGDGRPDIVLPAASPNHLKPWPDEASEIGLNADIFVYL